MEILLLIPLQFCRCILFARIGLIYGHPDGSPASVGDVGSIPGSGRSPLKKEGNGNPLWYSCLGNPMDRGA